MSDLFEKLVDSAGQVISEVDKGGQIQSAVSGLRQRLAETERRRRLNLVKQEIRDLQTQEAGAINALSAQVLALHEAGSLSQPELVSLCKGVDEVRTQIKEKQAELKQYQPSGPAVDGALCPHCGSSVVDGATFCQTCGGRIAEKSAPPPVLYCVHCGSDLRENSQFCPKCGQVVERN